MATLDQRDARGHPSHVIAAATRAYKVAKKLGQEQGASANIRKAFIKNYGDLRGECFYSIWLEWGDEA